jgi:hypothetical protein
LRVGDGGGLDKSECCGGEKGSDVNGRGNLGMIVAFRRGRELCLCGIGACLYYKRIGYTALSFKIRFHRSDFWIQFSSYGDWNAVSP